MKLSISSNRSLCIQIQSGTGQAVPGLASSEPCEGLTPSRLALYEAHICLRVAATRLERMLTK